MRTELAAAAPDAVIRAAIDRAWAAGCCTAMLATGSKRETALRFRESAGLERRGKTGFEARQRRGERRRA